MADKMKYKTESFTDRAELYRWASEKKDIECDGRIYKYGNDGYELSLIRGLVFYKKVIYIKTKKVEFWVNFYVNGEMYISDCVEDAKKEASRYSMLFIKTEKFETEIEVSE